MTNPGTAEACRVEAASRLRLGHHNGATKALRGAAFWDPLQPQVRLDAAFVAERSGDAARAMAEYEAALRLSPGHPVAHFNLGVLFHRLERYPDAKRWRCHS